jgi:hypothetical protein
MRSAIERRSPVPVPGRSATLVVAGLTWRRVFALTRQSYVVNRPALAELRSREQRYLPLEQPGS